MTLKGVWAATLTPLDERLAPDAATAIEYYGELLENGCHGLNVLGTTGEAMSLSRAQRLAFMSALAASPLDCGRLMIGTGAAALDDAVALTQVAFASGFAAALVMPPFFYRDSGEDGVVAFFDALLSRAGTIPPGGVLLYNFPAMSGYAFTPGVVDRLVAAFPQAIGGMKDSSNDAALQAEIARRHPSLAIFPSSEEFLGNGYAGCISGSVALWPQLARDLYVRNDPMLHGVVSTMRRAVAALPLIPAVRHVTARKRNDPRWERLLPPLRPLDAAQRRQLQAVSI